ncbi:MAG: RNA pseudouridine synthase [Saprospiraceae bacterium]|nr:RNA pseudouridine synthase [Saprospiraceae bacterium]
MTTSPACFIPFRHSTEGLSLPKQFTFPFHYQPHPLSILAAKELQAYLENQTEWQHNFGFSAQEQGLGKMFGVLVVQNAAGEVGYLAAFSGKLAGVNHLSPFVPPVFDMLDEAGFYRLGEEENNKINRAIEDLENNPEFLSLKNALKTATAQAEKEVTNLKKDIKEAKKHRDERRQQAKETLSEAEYETLQASLNNESAHQYFQLKDLNRTWKRHITHLQESLEAYEQQLKTLKAERKTRSMALQRQLFDNYFFLNQKGEKKSLHAIFSHTNDPVPPSGAGECAAPKLLQYAFLHQLPPLSMAEFWWGQSPSSEIRKHGNFYPACKSKCEPILAHMLEGIEMEANPLLTNPAENKTLDIVYEDDFLLVINKPADFFSIPGKKIDDSVQTRLQNLYPEATGPMIVHRLDSATSGLLLIAKTKEVHQHLQSQFIKRKIKKRYVALLEGLIEQDEGFIDLPLRVDLDNRPQQLVCYTHGKPAQTAWKVIDRIENRTKIHFFPITGRTHQLRVHAAHPQGLNTAIVGDDLYGQKADRLYLHAESLTFTHPISETTMTIEIPASF